MYLSELCQELLETTGVAAAPPTICCLLKLYGITRKQIRQVALQRNDALRGAFMDHCSLFDPGMFVWIDETGSDAKTNIRKYGYALRGVTPVNHRILSRSHRVNAMAAFSMSSVVAVEFTTTTVNTQVFFDYIRGSIVPNMHPFNGTNAKSIAIMDNLSVHRTTEVVDLFRQAGIMLMYSPDLNPAEEAFSYVKNYLRKHDSLLQVVPDPKDVIVLAFKSITTEHCTAWASHSGYCDV